MKHTFKRMLALLIALLLAMPTMAFAEDPAEDFVVLEDGGDSDGEAPAGEAGELLPPDDSGDEAPEEAWTDPDAVATYCFIADTTLLYTCEAREGEAVERPGDPAAPEGCVFAGWYLEDGTRLFEDGPVIAHPDVMNPEVNVFARFEEDASDEGASEAFPSGEGAGQSEADEVLGERLRASLQLRRETNGPGDLIRLALRAIHLPQRGRPLETVLSI